ncbi:hypothetical protein FB451DRAFT_1421741 [Mycena latifolia]|nr:hypothetical protein FB451DRAFT_1421741 [Mycena latifolia]
MKLTAALFTLIPLIYAIPAPEASLSKSPPRRLAPRAHFVCGNTPFVEPCTKFRGANGECVNFSAAFNDNISSVRPDSGQDCFFFVDGACSGASFGPIRSPGIANIPTNPSTAAFND